MNKSWFCVFPLLIGFDVLQAKTVGDITSAINSNSNRLDFPGEVKLVRLEDENDESWAVFVLGCDSPLNSERIGELLRGFGDVPLILELNVSDSLDLTLFQELDVRQLRVWAETGYYGPETVFFGKRLSSFEWHGSSWTNLAVLESMPYLQKLDLSNWNDSCVPLPASFFEHLRNLETLRLGGNWSFPDNFVDLPNLSRFEISHNKGLETVPGFSSRGLQEVSIFDSSITNINALANQPLVSFHASRLPLTDLSPLSQQDSLRRVELTHLPISDISPLHGLRLHSLDLSETRISDLSPLKGMPLSKLNLFRSWVRDVKDLDGLPLESIVFDPEAITNGMDILRSKLSIREFKTKGTHPYPLSSNPEHFWAIYNNLHPSMNRSASKPLDVAR